MQKRRAAVPKQVKEEVLREFNHRCAICGSDRPQLHHIDEDPSNNAPENLVPLCPNCHLTDQHAPTRRIEPSKLRLFRRYQDPAILSPEFEPLFTRLRYLDHVEINTASPDELVERSEELVSFVKVLQMGDFYGAEIQKLVHYRRPYAALFNGDLTPEGERILQSANKGYREQLNTARAKVLELAMELLRYQRWPQRRTTTAARRNAPSD